MHLHRILIFLVAALAFLFCFFAVAKFRSAKNLEIKECENFEYYETKLICYAYFLQNHSVCKLVPVLKRECYLLSTLKIKNPEECFKIGDQTGKAVCIFNLAFRNKNPKMCSLLKTPYLVESCLLNFPPTFYGLFSKEECKTIAHQSSSLTCLAITENNASYCNKITAEPFERDLCFALLNGNISLCKSDACKKTMAIYTRNASLCMHLSSNAQKSECIGMISRNLKECEKLFRGKLIRDFCKIYAIYAREINT